MENTSLFFVLGHNQKIIFDLIYDEIKSSNLVIFTIIPGQNYPEQAKVVDIRNPRYNIKGWYKLRQELNEVIKTIQGLKVTLYIPHVLNFLSNYFAFSKKINSRKVLIYDGLLNLNDNINKGILKKWMQFQMSQVFKAMLMGIRYKFISSRISGRDVINYEEIILPKGINVDDSEVIRRVSLPYETKKSKTNTCFILEQPIIYGTISDYASELISYLKSYDFDQIIIKPHPRVVTSKLFQIFLKEGLANTSVYVENDAAEKVIAQLNPSMVISTYSSALINVRVFFPHIKVVSLGLKYSTNKLENFINLFENYQIVVC